MEQFVIQSRTSLCRKREGGVEKALKQDIIAFYHGDYQGGGNWRVPSTIENLICTFKNDITTYPQQTLNNAINKLTQILKVDLPEILVGNKIFVFVSFLDQNEKIRIAVINYT